ncbi:MAG: nucleotidyl transferase AbiEii/AbiGii toxin family protein [Nitrososphaera sp.]
MIEVSTLRAFAKEKNLAVDVVEKDYVLGWILFGVASSALSGSLAFKGGTALSKVYFPGNWRLSEDLDFTAVDDSEMNALGTGVLHELPTIVKNACGMDITVKGKPLANPKFFRGMISYTGPLSRSKIKLEISIEPFVGEITRKSVPPAFDYPKFSVIVYALDNLLSEKMRAIIERGKIRDYYDVWRLLKTQKFDRQEIKMLFLQKCKSKEVKFTDIEQMFPDDVAKKLEPYQETWLTRLNPDPLPPLGRMVEELKAMLKEILT